MCKKNGKTWTCLVSMMVLALFSLASCEKLDTNEPVKNASSLKLYLTDSPADYDAVWIDVQKVLVHLSDASDQGGGWQELPLVRTGKYDLLHLRNGADTLLASADVPAGELSEIRLTLGQDNSIVLKNGDSISLDIPSGSTNEVTLEVENASLKPNTPFELVLDFNLAQSVHEPARPDSGQYYLDPVIHVFAKGSGASIEGWLVPDSAHAHVLAVGPYNDTLSALPEGNTGFFKFWGIPEGNYSLLFVADSSSGYISDTLYNIQAIEGQVVQTDTITLHK